MKKAASNPQPANEYDKVFKENMQQALPGIIRRLLDLHLSHSEDLPANLQQIKEREPDVLQRVADTSGHTFILHIEWQVKNDKEMVYRMGEYRMMLLRKYRLPVKQYVIYIGNGKPTMQDSITEERLVYSYHLLALSQVDYMLFLQSAAPEEKLLALLSNFGNEKEEQVVSTIIRQVQATTGSELQVGKYFNQLRVLAQLRNLPFKIDDMLDSVSTFFKPERDPFFKLGKEQGIEIGKEQGIEQEKARKNLELVTRLIEKLGLSDEQIADIAAVTVQFVKEVRQSLDK